MRTIKRAIAGAFIISGDNKLLIGKSRPGGAYAGTWIVPGGGIDPGESDLQALAREVKEETGLDISQAQVEKLPEISTGQTEKNLRDTGERVLVQMEFHDFVIRFTQPADQLAVTAEDDFLQAHWVTPAEIGGLTLSPPTGAKLHKIGFLAAE